MCRFESEFALHLLDKIQIADRDRFRWLKCFEQTQRLDDLEPSRAVNAPMIRVTPFFT